MGQVIAIICYTQKETLTQFFEYFSSEIELKQFYLAFMNESQSLLSLVGHCWGGLCNL